MQSAHERAVGHFANTVLHPQNRVISTKLSFRKDICWVCLLHQTEKGRQQKSGKS